MTPTATLSRAQRVELARQSALPRKPIPVLLILAAVYRDGTDPGVSLMFGPGVDRQSALERLRRKLDAVDPSEFAGVVAKWGQDHRARWVG